MLPACTQVQSRKQGPRYRPWRRTKSGLDGRQIGSPPDTQKRAPSIDWKQQRIRPHKEMIIMATMYPPRLQDEIDRLFGEILAENAPLTETSAPVTTRPQSGLLETWIAYFWQLALPGVDPHTLDIE